MQRRKDKAENEVLPFLLRISRMYDSTTAVLQKLHSVRDKKQYTFFYKKLVYKKLVLRWPKF